MSKTSTRIHIHCEYTLSRSERSRSVDTKPYTFRQTHSSGRSVEMVLSYLEGTIHASMKDVYWHDEVISELQRLDAYDDSAASKSVQEVVNIPQYEIRCSVHNLLALVKYHLRHFDLHESSCFLKSASWGTEKNEMKCFPLSYSFSLSLRNFSHSLLDENTHCAIQEALALNTMPLIAMRHLHRAKHADLPRYQWIDATIAAELAVKEVLCRARPEMELMLMEMPSPPFSKMYGSLLKHYLGEESPFRQQLIYGQEKRNALVHRPTSVQVGMQEANDYVEVVEGAIFHLLSLLHPEDELIKRARYITKYSENKNLRNSKMLTMKPVNAD